MQLFVSTTWHGRDASDLATVLDAMAGLDCDGIEIGSAHAWRSDFDQVLAARKAGRILVHNYFPPAPQPLVVNLASPDEAIRRASLDHAAACIRFAARIGAEVYTVHPGFVAEPVLGAGQKTANYDFAFAAQATPRGTALALMIDSLGRLAETARAAGVTLAAETGGSVTNPDATLLERVTEIERLFAAIPRGVALNFNLAHTRFAADVNGFSLEGFVAKFAPRFAAVELSHNDGTGDQHLPLVPDSFVLDWVPRLGEVPLILEFRNCARADLDRSLRLVRGAARQTSKAKETVK